VAAIAADDEVGTDFYFLTIVAGDYAGDAVVVPPEVDHLVLEEELKAGELFCVAGEEVEEVPLGHEGDEFAVGGDMAEVGDGEGGISEDDVELLNLLMGQLEEFLEQAQLMEDFEGGGVDGVAAEVAEEVLMLFEDGDGDALARKEIAEEDTGGATADDAAGCLDNGGRHGGDDLLICSRNWRAQELRCGNGGGGVARVCEDWHGRRV
jgi:hypothetical protein